MIKLAFEGANIAEVNERIQNYLASSGGVPEAVAAAGGTGKKTTTTKPPKEEKLTLEKLQLKCSSVVENASDKAGAKASIKAALEEFLVTKVTDLEESEYVAFMAKLEEI